MMRETLLAISVCLNVLLTKCLIQMDMDKRELGMEVRHLRMLLRREEMK